MAGRLLQSEKIPPPTNLTEAGSVIAVSEEQPKKALSPMVVTPSGIVTFASE